MGSMKSNMFRPEPLSTNRSTLTQFLIEERRRFPSASGDFNAASLDVTLDGQEIFPVADILAGRSLPFVFVTGYGERSLPDRYRDRPALQKPFQAEQLSATLAGMLAA